MPSLDQTEHVHEEADFGSEENLQINGGDRKVSVMNSPPIMEETEVIEGVDQIFDDLQLDRNDGKMNGQS